MKKTIWIYAGIIAAMGCTPNGPWVKHKVKLVELSSGCSQLSSRFSLSSNIGGDRYEFEKCLPAGYAPENVQSERRGDTVVVLFNKSATGGQQHAFAVTLDIDSNPAYQFIRIDEETYPITHSN